jgi:hypothetical protein
MTLREDRQALLDVFCHCYGVLLEYLDFLDRAVGARDDWSGYRLVQECVDTAASRLGSIPLETIDRQEVCREFLRRVRGAMEYNLRGDSPAFAAFSDYASAVKATSDASCVDLTEWQKIGEDLSRACYRCLLPADAPALCLSVEPVDLVGCNKPKLKAESDKTQGQGKITFGFAPDQFTFANYVNLPFFFLHEYLSHLHTAPTFAEYYSVQHHPFTEGWLMYYACLAYQRALLHEPHLALSHPLHREHYIAIYLQSVLGEEAHPLVCRGYELARQFAGLVGEVRFERATLLVASTPYNLFPPPPPDLHGEFVRRVGEWLRQMFTRSLSEREDRVAALDMVLDKPDPVRKLMEWLTC